MQWHYAVNGEQVGPLSNDELAALVADGTITSDTPVWNETMADWASYGSVSALQEKSAPPMPPAVPDEAALPAVSLDAQPVADVAGSVPEIVEYGGFWLRVAAKLIDQLVISVVTMPVSFVMMAVFGMRMASSVANNGGAPTGMVGMMVVTYVVMMVVSIAFPLFYHTWMVGKYGATLGKMACRLVIVRSDQSSLSYGRACGRYFGEMVTGMTMGIGYLIAAFDDEKKTLHDIICDTRVIKRT